MQIQPYLFFAGRCDDAIAFYRSAVGAEVVMLMRYKDSPDPNQKSMTPPGFDEKVMHGRLRIGETDVLVSDGHNEGRPKFEGFALSLTVAGEAEAERCFNALGAGGGEVRVPLTTTFFSPRFGMLTDQFGVLWIVYVAPQGTGAKG